MVIPSKRLNRSLLTVFFFFFFKNTSIVSFTYSLLRELSLYSSSLSPTAPQKKKSAWIRLNHQQDAPAHHNNFLFILFSLSPPLFSSVTLIRSILPLVLPLPAAAAIESSDAYIGPLRCHSMISCPQASTTIRCCHDQVFSLCWPVLTSMSRPFHSVLLTFIIVFIYLFSNII